MADNHPEQEKKESVWKILKGVLPDLIRALMRYAGTQSQERFATLAGVNANQVSRYINGTEFPRDNLAKLGKNLGLAAGSVWWLLGYVIERKYRGFKFDLDGKGSALRETSPPYGGLEERYRSVMELDLSALNPYDGHRLLKSRNALELNWEHYEGQGAALDALIRDLAERYTDALSRARSRRSS